MPRTYKVSFEAGKDRLHRVVFATGAGSHGVGFPLETELWQTHLLNAVGAARQGLCRVRRTTEEILSDV